MSYSVKITNESSLQQNVALYQTIADADTGYPLIWVSKAINPDNTNTIIWDIDWALNFGTSEQVLKPGVRWESVGTPRAVFPNNHSGANKIDVSYSCDDFKSSQAYNQESLPLGSMAISTDKSFTVAQSEKMSVSVYMNGKPCFAMQGRPNGNYTFSTRPTYYLCITDREEGVAVNGDYVSTSTQVVFDNGATMREFCITPTLEIEPK